MRKIWDQMYAVGIKNIVDAIANSVDKPNTNAALRIHRVYLMSVLTDIYGDIPCIDAGLGYVKGISNPKYDKQEDIYNWFFDELEACVAQLGTGSDHIGGDVTSLNGEAAAWKRYANTLRLRFAMRLVDVNYDKAKKEFVKALTADGGYIQSADQDAYIIYTDGSFTLYDGSRDLDFRVNALGEILYGQDPSSPTFVSSTFYNILKNSNDPRLYRICRHYLNTKRSENKPDREWNVDVTDEVNAYIEMKGIECACNPGAAWYTDWIEVPNDDISKIPTLERLVNLYPEVGFNRNNYQNRMLRPFLSIDFEMPDRPGTLINSAEVEFLLAEAKLYEWDVPGSVEEHFKAGVKASMEWLNAHYLQSANKISADEINTFANALVAGGALATKEKSKAEYCPNIYDDMIRNGHRLFCSMGDDNHNYKGGLEGSFGGFTYIGVKEFNYEKIMESLEKGVFYSSMGPIIKSLSFDEDSREVHIECSNAISIVYVGTNRTFNNFYGKDLTSASFYVPEGEKCFRVAVKDKNGLWANTNYYFLDEIMKE